MELKNHLNYCEVSGVFTRAETVNGKYKKGDVAGALKLNGYIAISIKGKKYHAHRLAWLYVHGHFPSDCIDHVNMNKSDNRIINLRLATKSQNMNNKGKRSNNKSGFKGVCWDKCQCKWKASTRFGGKNKHLGYFDSPLQASEAYNKFAIENHGEFFRG